MSLSSLAYVLLEKAVQPTIVFVLVGIAAFPVAAFLARVFAQRQPGRASVLAKLLCGFGRCLLRLRYRVQVSGADEVKRHGRRGILFLPNHPALIDPVILTAWLHGPFGTRPLALENQIDHPVIRTLAGWIGVLPIPDPAKIDRDSAPKTQAAITLCIEALKQGQNVLLYPAGRLMRQKFETLGAVSAAHRILSELPQVRVVLVRTSGLWGSSSSWGAGAPPRLKRSLWGHICPLLASGIFFAPKRRVRVELVEPTDLPRHADRVQLNAYLDQFYRQSAHPALAVPYSIWEGWTARCRPRPPSAPHGLDPAAPTPTGAPPAPEPPATISASPGRKNGHARLRAASPTPVPAATRRIVLEYLQEATGRTELQESQELARDLGLDSLAVTEIILWLQREFAVTVPNVEAVRTVGDIMLAAVNRLAAEAHDVEVPTPPAAWFKSNITPPTRSGPRDRGETKKHPRARIPQGATIGQVFLEQARLHPGKVIVADLQRGIRTYRDLLTAIFILRPRLAALEGRYVGILLPASVAADTVFLAALFAGKTPVMVNWTAGPRYIRHSLELLGVRQVLTAEVLLRRLAAQGTDLTSLRECLVTLEKFAGAVSWWEKVCAAIRARWPAGKFETGNPSDSAVVLFTSGSEALPKAVPLTHTNLLTNARDALSCFAIYENDCFLGMLPPFHSFGLTGTMLLPLLSGVKVVHHPNPNEVTTLARIIQNYRVSILLGTPTFLNNIVRGAAGSDLSSVRLGVTGAEKCPPDVYEALQNSCPHATILEGYGITECSPIVSVTREDDPRTGTIGPPLPSVETRLVDPETGQPIAPGQTGMLLVRGPSIFTEYLNHRGPSPFTTFNGQTWYRTGDLVKADAAGHLTFIGRLKRFVKIGGEMVSLPAIEDVLLPVFALPADTAPCLAVISTGREDQPELVLFTIRPLSRQRVNEVINAAGLSGLHHIRMVREISEIPLLGTGKVDYQALARLLAASSPAA